GKVIYDESSLFDINLRFEGWVGELNANYEGKTINKGDILFTVYSPELLSLQEEYLKSYQRNKDNPHAHNFIEASRKRLTLWGLNEQQIQWLENKGEAQNYIPIFSPANGVITKKYVQEGSSFKTGQTLIQIADNSSLWI